MQEITEKNTKNKLNARHQVALFLVGWLGFQIIATIYQVIVLLITKDSNSFHNPGIAMTINSLAYITLFTILVVIINKDYLLSMLSGFKSWKPYVAGAVCLISILAFNFVYNIFLHFVTKPITDNLNEQNIQSLTSLFPGLSFLVFGLLGPICEEITYRVGLFSLAKRKGKVFGYLVTIVVFALIHFNYDSTTLVNELLNLPFYGFAAFAFSYTYDKFGFAGSTAAHIFNNLLSLSLVVFIK